MRDIINITEPELSINDKVLQILQLTNINTKVLICEELDMSRPTLDTRLSGKSEWKKLEKSWINNSYNKLKRNR